MKKFTILGFSLLILLFLIGTSSAQTTANVTFQVDMRAQITAGGFDPAGTDIVEVAGSMNEWASPPADTLKDADGDSIYTGTFALDGTVGTTVHEFKFLQRTTTGDAWEDKLPANRKLEHPAADTTLPVIVFDVPYPNTAMVTFQLDMSVQMGKGLFNPTTDSVEVAGSFSGWADPPSAFLEDADADSVYTGTFDLTGTIGVTVHEYKYIQRKGGGVAWEDVDNRKLDHPAANTVLDKVFWADDPGFASTLVNVTFQVDMHIKMQEPETGDTYVFNPAIDIVEVAGSMNEWADAPADTLFDSDGDSIYTAILTLDGAPGFTNHGYKFLIRSPGGDLWEDNIGGDGGLLHPESDTVLPVVFYDGDEIVSEPATGNILFQVDAAVLEDIGFFSRANGDMMWVLGSFSGWEGALDDPAREFVMTRIPPDEIHELLVAYNGLTGDILPYKFYIEYADSAAYATKFNREWPGFFGWEEPATTGGADRRHTFATGGNQIGRLGFYADLPPEGIIPAGDTVTVTFHIDMNPAIGPGGFDPSTDPVFFRQQSQIQAALQGRPRQEADSSLVYTDDNSDNIYDLTYDIIGPAQYAMQYVAMYATTSEDHGLDAVGRHRVRYIQPLGPNQFPRTFEFDLDTWNPSPGPPHISEVPPFSPLTSVERVEGVGTPQDYQLFANYPNPFNPSTTIEFAVSKVGEISLAIYNVLGQKVRTLTSKVYSPGRYKIEWNGRNGVGVSVGSGVYFYRLKAGDTVLNKKMLLLK